MPFPYAKRSYSHSQSAVDLSATSRRLYSLLLEKDEHFWARKGSLEAVTMAAPGGPIGISGAAAAASSSCPPTARRSLDGSASGSVVGRFPSNKTVGDADRSGPVCLAALPPADLERERDSFLKSHTTDATRVDVQAWVGKVFNMMVKESQDTVDTTTTKFGKGRRGRSGGGTSDSGASGAPLAAAGASMATPSQKAPSLISAESLVVHHGQGVDVLSGPERLRAYLTSEIPELKQHVDKFVAAKCEEVRRRVDGDGADQFLKATTKRFIFGPQQNYTRWQNSRREKIDRVLEENMSRWIWEAVLSWDEHQALKGREAEVNESDLVYDYLTKRAANVDKKNLATEVAIFKPLMASYSLPTMWKDKYN